MYEIDFLPVGDGEHSGDAIAMRFTTPTGSLAHVIIDAGFGDDGDALVRHVNDYYGTNTIDCAFLTHPDGDHIGGMGTVVRQLNIRTLCLHDLGARGGASLDAADAVDDLMGVADDHGTKVIEAFAGGTGFDGAVRVLGPTEEYYDALVDGQLRVGKSAAAAGGGILLEAARHLGQRFLTKLPVEIPFDEGEGASPRNNSSMILLVTVGQERMLFTGDAGVEALEHAWDFAETEGFGTTAPDMIQIPHHGSRRNASSATLDRLLGPTGQAECRLAVVSVAKDADAKHPSPRVVNAYLRRGCTVVQTAGKTLCHRSDDASPRYGWGPAVPLAPMDESVED